MNELCAYGFMRRINRLFCSIDFVSWLTDLENFKTQRRSPVRVREGQGVVLLCGPPQHSGGKTVCQRCLSSFSFSCLTHLVVCPGAQQQPSVSEDSVRVVCALPLRSSGCLLSGSVGVNPFFFGTLRPVSPDFQWGQEKLWHADWKGCLLLGSCQAE